MKAKRKWLIRYCNIMDKEKKNVSEYIVEDAVNELAALVVAKYNIPENSIVIEYKEITNIK